MAKDGRTLKDKVTAFLARHGGNAEAAVTELLTDNQRYRTQLRDARNGENPYKPDVRVTELEGEVQRLEGEVDRLGTQIPQAGDVLLKGDDAKAWPLFKALGKPEDVKKQLDELPTLRTTVSDAQRKTSAAEAAALLKWNPDATSGLVLDKGLVVSLVDGKDKDGKAIKVAHVRPKDDEKAATVPMEDWVKTNAAYLLPALSATGGSSGSSSATSTTPTNVIPFPVQGAGGSPAATGDPVADFAKQAQAARDARPSPFNPPRTAAATT
jgi:hypothetical protein